MLLRMSNWTPSSRSRDRIVWDNAGWLTWPRRAAADSPPSSATATNDRNSRTSTPPSHHAPGTDPRPAPEQRPTARLRRLPDQTRRPRAMDCRRAAPGIDEWQVCDRRHLSDAAMALFNPPAPTALDTGRTDLREVIDQAALQTP
jgi:hypothetical protein